MGAITAEPQQAGAAFQLLLQFAQGQGLILAQAGQAAWNRAVYTCPQRASIMGITVPSKPSRP